MGIFITIIVVHEGDAISAKNAEISFQGDVSQLLLDNLL